MIENIRNIIITLWLKALPVNPPERQPDNNIVSIWQGSDSKINTWRFLQIDRITQEIKEKIIRK